MRKLINARKAVMYFIVNKKSLLWRITGEITVSAYAGRQTALTACKVDKLSKSIKLMVNLG